MARSTKDVCLGCTLQICDDKDAACKFLQITRSTSSRKRKKSKADENLKNDIIAILGRLIGEKAIDQAKANAASYGE